MNKFATSFQVSYQSFCADCRKDPTSTKLKINCIAHALCQCRIYRHRTYGERFNSDV